MPTLQIQYSSLKNVKSSIEAGIRTVNRSSQSPKQAQCPFSGEALHSPRGLLGTQRGRIVPFLRRSGDSSPSVSVGARLQTIAERDGGRRGPVLGSWTLVDILLECGSDIGMGGNARVTELLFP